MRLNKLSMVKWMFTKGSLSKLLLGWLDQHYGHLHQVEQQLEEKLKQYQRQLEQLDGIPGIDKTAATAILAETSIDMSRFKTAEHICSWAGLSPGNNESAGKKVPSHDQR
ncbi:transposase [Desulfotomaculum nigrificans]|uniref:transposase n=1 Tax=Desulfotomaculum nigrificans TaxID=1565 RepID=UPI0001FAE702